MKKIVCDLCDGTEFVKQDGMFVCQGCGTKYSAAEAKSMMREVEGDASPVVTGAPVMGAPMGNPNQQQIDNILVLATTAYEAQNYAEAESYCNQAVVLDVMCYKAWNLKGKAVGWQSKIDNLRIEEAAHSFCKAIDFAPEEEKEELKTQAVEELKNLGLALISLRKNRFSGSPDSTELNGFKSDRKVMIDSLMVLLSHGNAVGMPEGYLEQIATMMNEAAVAATDKARKAWGNIEHPSEKDLATYVDWMSNIASLLEQAIDACDDDDDEADIQRYKNLINVLEDPIGKYSYKREWNSYFREYRWVKDAYLADCAVASRRKRAQEYKDKIAAIERSVSDKKEKAEEEKKARIAAYWEAHAEEKAKLDAEVQELQAKKDGLHAEIADIDAQIKAATPTGPVPSEDETMKLRDEIWDLQNRRAKLGIFSGKEKKQITEQIATIDGRIDSLKGKIEDEKKARQAEADAKIAPLNEKKTELLEELDKASKRLSALEAEFNKDPEE